MDLQTLKKLDKKYARAIADYLLKRIETDNYLLDKMKETDKTIGGCLDYIKGEAKKEAEGGCAVLCDEDVFQLATHYFMEDSIEENSKVKTKKVEETEEETEEETNEETEEEAKEIKQPKELKEAKEEVKNKVEKQLTLFDFL